MMELAIPVSMLVALVIGFAVGYSVRDLMHPSTRPRR
jgi:hypothetical protein